MSVHSLFKITGNKVNVYDNKEISVEEFNEQVIAMGNLANSTSTENSINSKRASIYFSLKMNAGTKITFTGDSSVYNWAVVETYNNSFTSRVGETFSENRLDSGWNTSSSFTGTSKTEYYTQLHGGYIVITLKRVDGAAFSGDYSQLAKFHSMFKIEGIKYSDDAYLPQTEYGVKTVAHRGYSYYAPENTLSAYDYAAKAGFRYVECDVYFTKDNIPVLLHDSSIDRTSSGTGNIADLTYEEASQYDYGSWKGSQFAGEKLPTFEEFVILCRKLNLHPYIEIKGTITAEQANTLVGIVNKYHLSSDSSWISFDLIALEQIKLLDECARLGYVVSPISEAKIAEAVTLKTGKNEVFMDAYYTNATAANATLCKNNGLAFEVWTVNTITNFLSVDSYVTGFTTNMINVGFQKEVRK